MTGLCVALAWAAGAAAPAVAWEKLPLPPCEKASYNPEGERQAFAVQFDQQNRIYVGNRFNGSGPGCVLRTADGGKTWEPLGPPGDWSLKAGPNDGGFRIHPLKPDWFYMGGENRGVFVSFDGGKTWDHPVSGSWAESIGHGFTFAFHPTNPLRVYASGGVGVYRTDDGGKTWKSLGLPVSQTNWVAVDPAEPNRVYAAQTWKWGDLLRSTDGGDTWASAANGLPDGRVTPTGYPNRAVWQVTVGPKDGKTVYASTATGLFASANGGDDWRRLGPAAKPGTMSGMLAFALHPTDPAVIAGSGYLGRVQLSRDGGTSWADITGDLRTGAMSHRAFGIRVGELAFDPGDPNALYVARSDGLYRARLPKP